MYLHVLYDEVSGALQLLFQKRNVLLAQSSRQPGFVQGVESRCDAGVAAAGGGGGRLRTAVHRALSAKLLMGTTRRPVVNTNLDVTAQYTTFCVNMKTLPDGREYSCRQRESHALQHRMNVAIVDTRYVF